MCGFCGWILKTEKNSDFLVSGLRSIKHRGPDDTLIAIGDIQPAVYSSELSNPFTKTTHPLINKQLSKTCFGFNRLSIVDLSNNAMQPFLNKEQDLLFMMNGEIYNYSELKNEYLSYVQFNSGSDSEVAFHLYKKFGNSFIDKLKGMFSIVIYNYKTQTLSVWRDRLGIKPFYYTITDQGFFFSSEMKGLFAMQLKKELNYSGLAYSMYLGTCPSPLTIYQNIFSLQAGHYLEYSNKTQQIVLQNYWHLKYIENHDPIDSTSFYRDIENICSLYATGQVDKAIMLSGGIDSGTLAYFYGKQSDDIEAIHIHTDKPDSEYAFAQHNAQNAGISINNYCISQKFSPSEVEFFLNSEEEPNSCPEPALFLCAKIANKKIKVLYNALGPDEIFGGYAYYQQINKLSKYPFTIAFLRFIAPKRIKHKVEEIKNYGLDAFPFIARQLFTWNEVKNFLIKNNQPIPEHPIQFIKNQILEIYPEFTQIPLLKKASYYDIFYYIASHHTFRCDQPSMRYSIEMRFPFLEHTFIEKYFNQSNTFNLIHKNLKPEFRKHLKPILSPEIFTMKKSGFTIPIEQELVETKNVNKNKQWYLLMLEKIKR